MFKHQQNIGLRKNKLSPRWIRSEYGIPSSLRGHKTSVIPETRQPWILLSPKKNASDNAHCPFYSVFPLITSGGKPQLGDKSLLNNPHLLISFLSRRVFPGLRVVCKSMQRGSIKRLICSITREQQAANIQTQKLWLNISYIVQQFCTNDRHCQEGSCLKKM